MLATFFSTHPVFTTAEATSYLATQGAGSSRTRRNLLHYHARHGHIIPIRRGVWAAVPPGAGSETWRPDPYAVCSKLTSDAVIGYRSALTMHGLSYTTASEYTYLTSRPARVLEWRDLTFRPVLQPAALRRCGAELVLTTTLDRGGVSVVVTTPERTIVDVLDRPELVGGWEEVWRAAEAMSYLNVAITVEYALLLENATTAAKLGLFLESHQEAFHVDDATLVHLEAARPASPHYADRRARDQGQLATRWNLIVPKGVIASGFDELVEYASDDAIPGRSDEP